MRPQGTARTRPSFRETMTHAETEPIRANPCRAYCPRRPVHHGPGGRTPAPAPGVGVDDIGGSRYPFIGTSKS